MNDQGIERRKEIEKKPGRTKTIKRTIRRTHLRDAVLELPPSALETLVRVEAEGLLTEAELTSDEDDAGIDYDLAESDEDETPEIEGDSKIDMFSALLNRVVSFSDSATLSFGNIYAITVLGNSKGCYTCHFEPPSFFYATMSDESAQLTLRRIVVFLKKLRDWLETNKQKFLEKPTARNFVSGEPDKSDFVNNPIVTQKGLLARISASLPEKQQLSEADLSRLLNKIWILWPKWNMPLQAVFSKEYCREWVLVGLGKKKISKEDLIAGALTANQIKNLKGKNLSTPGLSNIQELYLLAGAVRIDPRQVCEDRDAEVTKDA